MPIAPDVKIGERVRIFQPDLVNLDGCSIGDDSKVGAFVEMQKGVTVGRLCKISSHSFLCEGVTIEDEVFVGHGVMFTNDLWPHATDRDGKMLGADGWVLMRTLVKARAALGNGATVLPVSIGEGALVAAGAVVTRDVP